MEVQDSIGEWFGGQDDSPDSWRAQLRLRASQDFILRSMEAQEAAMDGEDWVDDAPSDPASKKAMIALRVPAVGETREQGCAVCLEDFVAGGKKLRMMPCSHSFHQRCIFDWLYNSRVCPVCRFALPRCQTMTRTTKSRRGQRKKQQLNNLAATDLLMDS